MGIFKCRHGCGAECYSKNPMSRSVFINKKGPGGYTIDLIRSMMVFTLEPDPYRTAREGDPPPMDFVAKLTMWHNEQSREEGLKKLIDYLRDVEPEHIQQILCQHSWEPVNGPQDYEV